MIKQDLFDEVQKLEELCKESCRFIWEHPETGGYEKESSEYVQSILKKEGFRIWKNENLPYAFCAEYGEGKPVIAITGEYDALPGLSQKASVTKEPVEADAPGHGCGHNLLGSASLTAAIAVKRFLEEQKITGTIRFYGCPEEELLVGKVKMAYYHMFDGCDAAITWHPMTANMAHDRAYLANASAHFYFTGRTAHAAAAPHMGRSALDAVELMNVGCNYLREHVIDRTRIHYTTDSGGFAPNIVPSNASAWYYVRAPHLTDVKETLERIKNIARGAAMMTETEVEIQVDYGCSEQHENNAFADLVYANLIESDGPKYTTEEMEFAKALQASIDTSGLEREQKLLKMNHEPMALGVSERDLWRQCEIAASSDTGDLSCITPTCLFTTACWPIGVAAHTWQASAASGSSLGEKGALYAAKTSAGIAYDLFTKPAVLEKIKKEFNERVTEEYVPMYEP